MSHILYSEKGFRKHLILFIGIITIWSSFLVVANSIANSVGAIIISGTHHRSFGRDVSNMFDALTNTSVGYGISSSNIYSGTNQSFADFQSAITQMNNSGISELHMYMSSHGNKNTIKFSDRSVSKNEFISAINQSSALTKHIVLDSCFSGTFYNDLSAIVGQDGTIITAADENHETHSLLTSWFTSALTKYMQDADSDSNEDGKVTYDEALDRVKKEGGLLPNLGRPKSVSIPTLSEWKQIFLTLVMLSLIMGFLKPNSPKVGLGNTAALAYFGAANYITFKKELYYKAMAWTAFTVVLGLAGGMFLFGPISMLDITGTLFCAPLVAYIFHLLLLFWRDMNIK